MRAPKLFRVRKSNEIKGEEWRGGRSAPPCWGAIVGAECALFWKSCVLRMDTIPTSTVQLVGRMRARRASRVAAARGVNRVLPNKEPKVAMRNRGSRGGRGRVNEITARCHSGRRGHGLRSARCSWSVAARALTAGGAPITRSARKWREHAHHGWSRGQSTLSIPVCRRRALHKSALTNVWRHPHFTRVCAHGSTLH